MPTVVYHYASVSACPLLPVNGPPPPHTHSETGTHELSAADRQQGPSRLERLGRSNGDRGAGVMLKNVDDDN